MPVETITGLPVAAACCEQDVEVVVARGDLDRVHQRRDEVGAAEVERGADEAEAAGAGEVVQLVHRLGPEREALELGQALGLRGGDEEVRIEHLQLDRVRAGGRGLLDQFAGDAEVALVVVADLGHDRDPLGGVDGAEPHARCRCRT